MSQANVSVKITKPEDEASENESLEISRYESDVDIDKVKRLVMRNYNRHSDRRQTPAITIDLLRVVFFAKALDNWKAIVISPVIRGLLYEVSYNGRRNEAYIEVYKKISEVKVRDNNQ